MIIQAKIINQMIIFAKINMQRLMPTYSNELIYSVIIEICHYINSKSWALAHTI